MVDIVHIDTGSDDPVPWFVVEDVPNLWCGLRLIQPDPLVIDVAASFIECHIADLTEHVLTIRILKVNEVSALELRIGVGDSSHRAVVGEEVVLVGESNGLEKVQSIRLGLVKGEFP